jgi:hypothetical protein
VQKRLGEGGGGAASRGRDQAAGLGTKDLERLPGRSAQDGAGEAGEGKDRGVLRMAGGETENAERRQCEPNVEKNGMEAPLAKAAANARQIYRGEKAE